MGSMWLRWVCSDVSVVCFDRYIMGQVVDQYGGPWVMGYGLWVLDLGWSGHFFGYFLDWSCGFDVFWVFSGLIDVSWVKLWSKWLWCFSRYFLGWLVYHRSSSDQCGFDVFMGWSSAFFWVFSMAWVSNRQHGFLISDLGLLISGLGGGSGSCYWLQLVCVWLYWWFGGLCLCV